MRKTRPDQDDQPCTWSADCGWTIECGYAFAFTNDGPKENGFKFCPKCGKPIAEKPYKEEE